MAFLLEIALSNVLVAGLLAVTAGLAGLWGRRPALTHALWLLVLLKLVTPPLFDCPIPWLPASSPVPPEVVAQAKPVQDLVVVVVNVEEIPDPRPQLPVEPEGPPDAPEPRAVEQAAAPPAVPPILPVVPAPAPIEPAAPAAEPTTDSPWPTLVLAAWLFGSCIWLALALRRLWRFQRLLRFAQPAPAWVQELCRGLADALTVRCPEVCLIPGQVSPMLWTLGTRRLLLPARLLERLDADQLTTLLAHELAHWRRRDDRVRWLEFVVLALYWWCPLAWWARREMHQAEEECCDAWVVSILPDSAKSYALALVETVDFLSGAPALPVLASGLGRVRLLKRRLTMILQGKTPRALTFTGLLAIAAVGLMLLPMVFSRAQAPAQQRENRQDEQRGENRDEPERKGGQKADQPRDEVRRLQEEIQRRQHEMQDRMREMEKMMQRLKQLERGNRAGPGGQPGFGGPGPMPGGGGRGVPQGGGAGGGPRGGAPGGGGGQGGPGVPGMPPGAGGAGGMPGMAAGGHGGNIEQRLNQLERKLDMVLQELRNQRGDGRAPKAKLPTPRPRAGDARPDGRPNNFAPNTPAPPVPPPPPAGNLNRDE